MDAGGCDLAMELLSRLSPHYPVPLKSLAAELGVPVLKGKPSLYNLIDDLRTRGFDLRVAQGPEEHLDIWIGRRSWGRAQIAATVYVASRRREVLA